MKKRRLIIDDNEVQVVRPVLQSEKLSEDFGRNLDTIAKARLWLTNPFNWHESNMYVLKWNGLIPSVNRNHGMNLVNEPHDDGLPIVVVRQQRDIKNGKKEPVVDIKEE